MTHKRTTPVHRCNAVDWAASSRHIDISTALESYSYSDSFEGADLTLFSLLSSGVSSSSFRLCTLFLLSADTVSSLLLLVFRAFLGEVSVSVSVRGREGGMGFIADLVCGWVGLSCDVESALRPDSNTDSAVPVGWSLNDSSLLDILFLRPFRACVFNGCFPSLCFKLLSRET
jgi:hypothetical protein